MTVHEEGHVDPSFRGSDPWTISMSSVIRDVGILVRWRCHRMLTVAARIGKAAVLQAHAGVSLKWAVSSEQRNIHGEQPGRD
jgi:hypothetical protein